MTSLSNPFRSVPSVSSPQQPARQPTGPQHRRSRIHLAPSDYNRFLQLHLAGASSSSSSTTSNPLDLRSSSFNKLHEPYPEPDTSSPGYGYTYGGWLRRNYTDAEDTPYTLSHAGSNKLNMAMALVHPKLDGAYMALTNVGGDAAMAATSEALLDVRDGTISLLQ